MRFALAFAILPLIAAVVVGAMSRATNGGSGQRSERPQYDHIFVIVEENEEASSVIGNANAPTFNQLGRRYGTATNYFGVIHPSEGNYVALTDADAHGITDDHSYSTHQFNNPSLVSRLEAAGLTWKGYFQSLPSPGFTGPCWPDSSRCLYASKHNGFMNFSQISGNAAELQKIVPDTVLVDDLAQGTLPNYSFIVPDQCHDMHGLGMCPDLQTNVAVADDYLKTIVEAITGSQAWATGRNAIAITFDEGDSNLGCCDAVPGGGQILTIVITNRQTAPIQDPTPYNHYSLVATIEKAFGVPCTQFACDTANVPTMDTLFELN
ncbi:MAG TPA: alkaline phosphatase family protein [Chloroflexota bacterium]|nr:alkaline phosphatase family protein [Chloroflexota bacterium]